MPRTWPVSTGRWASAASASGTVAIGTASFPSDSRGSRRPDARRALDGVAETVANIHQWTLRQAVTPDRLAGRVTAGHRFIVYGACALGAFASGALGSAIGVRAALLVFAIGIIVSPLLAQASALRGLRDQPADVDEEAVAEAEGAKSARRGGGGRLGIPPLRCLRPWVELP